MEEAALVVAAGWQLLILSDIDESWTQTHLPVMFKGQRSCLILSSKSLLFPVTEFLFLVRLRSAFICFIIKFTAITTDLCSKFLFIAFRDTF